MYNINFAQNYNSVNVMIIHKTEINNETDEFSTYYPFRVYLWCDLSIEKWICF